MTRRQQENIFGYNTNKKLKHFIKVTHFCLELLQKSQLFPSSLASLFPFFVFVFFFFCSFGWVFLRHEFGNEAGILSKRDSHTVKFSSLCIRNSFRIKSFTSIRSIRPIRCLNWFVRSSGADKHVIHSFFDCSYFLAI